MRWYVVRTQPNAEMRAAEHLARQEFGVYLPTHLRRRRHARRVETVRRPLFSRYLFVELDAGARWRAILSTVGVADLIRAGDAPMPVPAAVVETLRANERAGAFDETGAARLAPGQRVRVLAGPFADFVGRIAALADTERVYVLLDFLGREVRAKLAADTLAPA
jgi:transcriptional antiterminator RfaH